MMSFISMDSFRSLMALADAAAAANDAGQGNSNPLMTISNSPYGGDRTEPNFTASPLANQDFSVAPNSWKNKSSCGPDTCPYEFLTQNISTQYAPITTDQSKKAENKLAHDFLPSSMDEEVHQEKNRQVDEDETTRVQVNHDKVQQQLTIDSSRTVVSKELQENQNPDKGSNTGIDLNITPQQKPRRKKHRPKVILEGKPKRTTPKTHDKQGITMQMQKGVNNDLPSAPRSPNNSNCSSSTPCLTEEKRARGLKRGHSYTTNEAENIRRNMIGGHFSSLDEYLAMFPASACNNHGIPGKLFPAIYKTKRTEKGHCTPTSSKLPTRGLKKKKEEDRARGLKRGHSCTTNEAEDIRKSMIGGRFSSLDEYLAMFPTSACNNHGIPGKLTPRSSTPPTAGPNSRFPAAQFNPSSISTKNTSFIDALDNNNTSSISTKSTSFMKTQGKEQGFECKLALDQKGWMTKKRTKGPTRVRDFVSLIGIIGCNQFPTFPAQGTPMTGDMQMYTTSHNRYVCMEALIADSLATTTKKRTKRNSFATGFIEGLNAQVEKLTKSVVEMVDAQARMKEELEKEKEKEKELRLAAEKQVAELTKQAKVDMTTIAGLVEKSREARNLTLGQERSSISPTKHPSTSNFGN